MKDFVRRSNLMVPVTSATASPVSSWSPEGDQSAPAAGNDSWLRGPDAVTLDLEDRVPQNRKVEARALVQGAIPQAGRGAVDVFVRVNKQFLAADIEASVWPGLTGIMLPKVEYGREVAQASQLLEDMERRRGIDAGTHQLIVLLESAVGVWNIREIITESPRVSQVALGEKDLCFDLDIVPSPEYDPFEYARGRLVVEATAVGVQPVMMAHPLGLLPASVSSDEVLRLATVAKNLGSKGIICSFASWIGPVNAAFTTAEEQVEYYTEVREAFAQAIADGTAAIPFRGRMIDVPVDEWARVVLEKAALCKARDEEKHLAWEREVDQHSA